MSTPNSSRHEKRQKHVQSRFNLSGDAWADIVNKQPLNSAFLFKVTHKTFPITIFIKSDYFRFLCFYETRTTLWRTSSSIVWNSLGSSGLGSAQLTLHNFRESALNNNLSFTCTSQGWPRIYPWLSLGCRSVCIGRKIQDGKQTSQK